MDMEGGEDREDVGDPVEGAFVNLWKLEDPAFYAQQEHQVHNTVCTYYQFSLVTNGLFQIRQKDSITNTVGHIYNIDRWQRPTTATVSMLAIKDHGLELGMRMMLHRAALVMLLRYL